MHWWFFDQNDILLNFKCEQCGKGSATYQNTRKTYQPTSWIHNSFSCLEDFETKMIFHEISNVNNVKKNMLHSVEKHVNKVHEHIIAFHALKILWPKLCSTKFQMWTMWKRICYIPKPQKNISTNFMNTYIIPFHALKFLRPKWYSMKFQMWTM